MKSRARRLAFVLPFVGLSASGALAQTTVRASVDSAGAQLQGASSQTSMSSDGRYVAFQSTAQFVTGDTNGLTDVFVRDTLTGETVRASIDPSGTEFDDICVAPAISGDGRHVVFVFSPNMVAMQLYARDLTLHQTALVSATPSGQPGNSHSGTPSLSADGRYVAFASGASDLVAGDTNGAGDVFVRDVQTGTTVLVSRSSAGVQGDRASHAPAISSDGHLVAFASNATNLVAGDTGDLDLFLRDLQAGTTVLLTQIHPSSMPTSTEVSISSDGNVVVFSADASLVPADTNGATDVYAYDVQAGTTTRVSVDSAGTQAAGSSKRPEVSPDGRYVAFESDASTLVPGDTNAVADVFVRDLVAGTTRRASISSAGLQASGASRMPSISAGGQHVAFESDASDLVTGDTNAATDVFRIDRTCTGAISTYCVAKTNSLACVPSIGSSGMPSLSGADDFHVTATNVRNNKFGMMLWSRTEANVPFFDGIRCVGSPFKRTPLANSGGSASGNDCTGAYDYHFTQAYMVQQSLGGETTVHAQFWSRDPGFAPPNNIGLTNALRFTICP